jgi:hypothetical protein
MAIKEFNDKFCPGCGGGLIKTAVICPHCGSPVPAANDFSYGSQPRAASKQKTTAVLLAVFLSAWAWLYTYKWNALNFWLSFAGLFVGQVVTFAIAWFAGLPVVFLFVVNSFFAFLVWLGAVLGNARLTQQELDRYPNR